MKEAFRNYEESICRLIGTASVINIPIQIAVKLQMTVCLDIKAGGGMEPVCEFNLKIFF